MASVNVEIVRSICGRWEQGDWSSVVWADPEIEFVLVTQGPEPGRWTGIAGMAGRWRETLSAYNGLRIEVEGYRELDHERVLVLTRFAGHGKRSGLDVAQLGTAGLVVFHLRDGTVRRLAVHSDRDRALAELGVVPELGSEGT